MPYQSTKYGNLDFSKSRIGLNNVGNTPYAVDFEWLGVGSISFYDLTQ